MDVIFDTTAPHIGRVVLYEATWTNKIIIDHPEMVGKEQDVQTTVENPTHVIASATVPGNILLVNTCLIDPTGRSLRVPVTPRTGKHEVRSAYYSSNVSGAGRILWTK